MHQEALPLKRIRNTVKIFFESSFEMSHNDISIDLYFYS